MMETLGLSSGMEGTVEEKDEQPETEAAASQGRP